MFVVPHSSQSQSLKLCKFQTSCPKGLLKHQKLWNFRVPTESETKYITHYNKVLENFLDLKKNFTNLLRDRFSFINPICDDYDNGLASKDRLL